MNKVEYSRYFFTTVLLIISISGFAQTIKLPSGLQLTKLSENTYIHTFKNNNGIVYINNGDALLVSTPNSDIITEDLLNWVQNTLNKKIVGYIIDRWHPDAMGGLNIVKKAGIKTYAYKNTIKIARQKNLPIPEESFDTKLTINIGSKKVICHFLGEAHTTDGIVVWIPEEKVLFGGNEIRNNGGWIGNIADANLTAWSTTASNIKQEYGEAKFVIPGHGSYGGKELIDYTIGLYKLPSTITISNPIIKTLSISETIDCFLFEATDKEINPKGIYFFNGKVSFKHNSKEIEVYSDTSSYSIKKKQLYIPIGFINIKDKEHTTSFKFNQLYVNLWNTEIGMTIVIKEQKK